MADLASYQSALQRAQAAGDDEAVAYFQQRIAELQQQQNINQYMQPEQGDAQRRITKMQKDFAEQTGITIPESVIAGLVGAGKGATDIVRGLRSIVGLDNSVQEGEVENWEALQEEYPVSSTVGEIASQAAPFVAAGPLAAAGRTAGGAALSRTGLKGATSVGKKLAAPLSRRAAIGGQAALGAAEGGLIMAGQAAPIEQINNLQTALQRAEANNDTEAAEYFRAKLADAESSRATSAGVGAGVGGTIAGTMEALMPSIGRAIGKIGRKLIFRNGGQVTPELAEALAKEGLTPDDAKPVLAQIYAELGDNANPTDVANMALFQKYGITPSRGDVTQDFAQQKMEAQLVESAADDLGAPMRSLRREQSDSIRDLLQQQIDDLGVPERAGEALKDTLGQRKARLKSEQRALYNQLAEEAANVDAIPLDVNNALDFDFMDDVLLGNESVMNGIKKRLMRFGIGAPEEIGEFIEAGGEVTPLTLQNAEQFRKRLNDMGRGDPKVAVAIQPLKNALDEQYDLALEQLEQVGRASELGDIARKARGVTREIKTEFDPQATVGRLVAVKRNGVEPVVEASNALREIFSTGQVSKKERLQRVLQALKKEGDAGSLAVGDIQSAAMQRIIDDAFNAASRTIEGERVLSGASLIKAIDRFGDENLEVLFRNKPDALKMIRDLRSIGEKIQPPAGAIPKGSASVILDSLNRLGIMSISQKVPGLGIVLEGLQSLTEKRAKREAAQKAGKAVPRWTQREIARATQIRETMPQLAAALGIASIPDNKQEEEENEPLR